MPGWRAYDSICNFCLVTVTAVYVTVVVGKAAPHELWRAVTWRHLLKR